MPFPLRTRTRGRPGRGAGVKSVAAAPSFNPLTSWTTDPVHGVWASDPLWTPPADGGAVSSWRNGGSVGTPNFTQATGSRQPTYRASTAAFNNQPTVQADGTDDTMVADTANFAQPVYTILIAAKGKSAATDEALIDRLINPGHMALYTDGSVGGTAWKMSNGATVAAGGTADTSPHLFRLIANGAASSLLVDETTVATIDWSGATGGFDGLTLFSSLGGAAYFSSGHIALLLIFNTNPAALPEWAEFKAWVTSTYGITIA